MPLINTPGSPPSTAVRFEWTSIPARAAGSQGWQHGQGGRASLTWRDSKLFSEAERLALEYAERITYTDQISR